MADDKKPYIAPNGLAIVKLTTHRYGVHNPGEVAGFDPETAEQLVKQGFASYVDAPTAAPVASKDQKPAAK